MSHTIYIQLNKTEERRFMCCIHARRKTMISQNYDIDEYYKLVFCKDCEKLLSSDIIPYHQYQLMYRFGIKYYDGYDPLYVK